MWLNLFSFVGRFPGFLVAAALLAVQGLPSAQAAQIPDFTFIQISDIHAPMAQSRETLALLQGLGEVDVPAYGMKAPKPDFILATGDLTEFGGGSGWWQEYLSYLAPSGLKVYHAMGNHDNTWHAGIKALRDIGQGPYYSFDHKGCHFVCLMSASLQDPRPAFGEEQLVWLRNDLKNVSPETPVFVFFHHPVPGSEFASTYDFHRVMDALRSYNVQLVMEGHSHGVVHGFRLGFDQMTGGSTFGNTAGYAVISVKDGVLRAAYRKAGEPTATQKLLEKTVPSRASYPKIDLSLKTTTQVDMSGAADAPVVQALQISATIDTPLTIESAAYTLDDQVNGDLALVKTDGGYAARVTATPDSVLPGRHFVRVTFKAGEMEFTRSEAITLRAPQAKSGGTAVWERYLGASSKSTPTLADGKLFLGDNAGKLWAISQQTGEVLWSVETGAEIMAQPLVTDSLVITANGNGLVSAYDVKGAPKWQFTAGDSVYSSPVFCDGKVIFGCNDGKLHALDASTGKPAWENADAEYSIESKAWVDGTRIYYGAWDQYVRCVDATNGQLVWKELCEGSRTAAGAKRYYSAGDAMPVVAGGKVFIADRKYMLSIMDAATGKVLSSQEGVAATGVSQDGKHIYLRKVSGELVKMDLEGTPVWSVDCGLNAIPTAPVERDGVVFVCSSTGTVSAVSARFGSIMWQYQASPKLFVMSAVATDGVSAYVPTFEGYLIAAGPR